MRNKREGTRVKKNSNTAKTFLDLLNVFCYHFTTELQRKISTEQAESLLGNLIDKGILVMVPAQECHRSTRDLLPGSNHQLQQELPAPCQISVCVQEET